MNINTITNGYELENDIKTVVNAWVKYIENNFDVKDIRLFYYGDRLIFADVHLNNGDYGRFNITAKSIRFNGCTCTNDEYKEFGFATYNDDLYDGKVII